MVEGLVSIIMPSWNTAKFIAESIESVIAQTYTNWELIIVDDCSTDNTDEVVKKFTEPAEVNPGERHCERSEAIQKIRYLKNDHNMGAALTRNRALREAQGEWIAFLDSDDLWMPQKLEKQIEFMQEYGYVLSYTEYEKIDEDDKPLGIYVTGPRVVNKRRMYNYDYIGQLTMMYSAKHFGLIQIKDIKKNNDYAIRLQLYKKTNTKAYLLRENLAKYRIRKKSISHDKLIKKLRSHYDLFHMCDEKFAPIALWYACWNMWYGVWKKKLFERANVLAANC
jgi:glycosyltransferase involved in cell wall biosynthesis